MFKSVILLLSLILFLNARENPFFPSKDSQDLFITSNQIQKHEQLKRATITLPSSARIIKELSVEYVNLDGSIERKSISLDNSIDWHLPLFISQSYSDDMINPRMAPIKKEKKEEEFKKIAAYQFISFFSKEKTLKIVTQDKKIRNFMLVDPYRLVIDFKQNYDFRSFEKNIKNSIFKTIRIGNHKGYYRVVVELDGQYKCDFKKDTDSYLLNCY